MIGGRRSYFQKDTGYGRRNGAKFNESKSLPTSTTNLGHPAIHQSAVQPFFFYINNKIHPTSTINIIINIRNMPNSTTRENQHQQKFLFFPTTICLTTKERHLVSLFPNMPCDQNFWVPTSLDPGSSSQFFLC